MVIGELRQVQQGMGRAMASEVNAFINMADATTDPMALMSILNQAKYSLQVGYSQAQKFPEFKKLLARKDPTVDGMNPADYYTWYNNTTRPEDLPSKTGGGLNLAPTPFGAAKGGTTQENYNDAAGVAADYRAGKLTRDQAAAILKNRGWGVDAPPPEKK